MKTKHIKSFIFSQASYQLSDGKNIIKLEIDYQNNRHNFKKLIGENSKMEQEAAEIADDLLKRKHGINFAEK